VSEKHPGRAKYFLVCAEPTGSAMTETGFNRSAVAAFREKLTQKFRTIAALNKAWNTSYPTFEEIDPRQYSSARPNGLMYEFELFRHEGYFEWVDLMKASLKEHLPDAVLLNDFHNALDRPFDSGIDAVGMFKSYDVVGNHYYGKHASQPLWMHRLLDSLRKAYGTALGNFEWIGDVRCPDIFDQDAFKACGLMDMFEQMAWGRSMLAIWYGGSAGFAEGGQYWAPNLGQSILRYSTTYIPIGRLRFRRFGQIALTYPTVAPKVAIMEPTTSYLNGIHVRDTMEEVSVALGERQWNFGYIHEHALLEGAQSLDGIETLIVPRGVCLKPETSETLLAWLRRGNTLIALLPPGLLDQYGQPDGSLLRAAMGEVRWALNEDFTEATAEGAEAAISAVADDQCKLVRAQCGKGLLAVYTASDPFPHDHLLDLVKEHTPRDVSTASGLFRIVLRESDKHLYLFVVNPDLYDAQEDEIVLAGEHPDAVDLGCDVAFPVKSRVSDGTTRLRLRLAPGEGTVVRVNRQRAW